MNDDRQPRTLAPDDAALVQLLARETARRLEAEEAEQRFAFLAEASELLAKSLDYETTLASVAQLAVPRLADWCSVDIVDDDGVAQPVALAHADPAKVALAREYQLRYPADPRGAHGTPLVLRTGEPEVIPEVTDAMIAAAAVDSEHLEMLRALGLNSIMCVPLQARGKLLGAITFVSSRVDRLYGPIDLALAEDLARTAALAVDNARLYRELQDATRSRSEFVSSVSHDLKNPLVAIKGRAQLLRRNLARSDPPDLAKLIEGLEAIDTVASRMTAQINDLVDAVRGHLEPDEAAQSAWVDLGALVRQVVNEHQQSTERHQIVVDVERDGMVGRWDAGRIERVVTNLVSNAIKFSPEGGTIDVRVLADHSDGRCLARICVRDRGIGIPAADLPHVFERFRRAGNAVGRIPGTGIGLAGVKRIVEQYGGTVEVDSAVGTGSTFTVRLPLS